MKIIAKLLNKTEIEVQKRWKSLRTVFSRKLAQLKEKMPSGSGADVKKKSTNIEWEYWGDMQFLIPHMRHRLNRTSNFYKKPLSVSAISGSLISSLNAENSVLKPAAGTYKKLKCTVTNLSSLQNANLIISETSNSAAFLSETNNETFSSDESSHIESWSASSIEQKTPVSANEAANKENEKYSSTMKYKRKVPIPDRFHMKKKKEFEYCSTRMSEASQYLKETLDTVRQSLKDPSGNDDLQYFTCLLPIFKKLDDNQKTECLMTLLNIVKKYGDKNK